MLNEHPHIISINGVKPFVSKEIQILLKQTLIKGGERPSMLDLVCLTGNRETKPVEGDFKCKKDKQ